MFRPIMLSAVGMVAAIASLALGQPAPAPAGGATAAGSGSSASPDTAEADAKAALETLKTQQQVPTVRGGTLGIPSSATSQGLQVMTSTPVSIHNSSDSSGFNLFTQLGGIDLSNSIRIDLFGEQFHEALPEADLLHVPVVPHMVVGEMRDFGFRVGYVKANSFEVQQTISEMAAAGTPPAPKSLLSTTLRKTHLLSATAGVRFLQRPSQSTTDSLTDISGAAVEGMFEYASTVDLDPDNTCQAQLTAKVTAATTAATVAEAAANKAKDTESSIATKLKVAAQNGLKLDSLVAETHTAHQKAVVASQSAAQANDTLSTLTKAKKDNVCATVGFRWTVFGGASGMLLHSAEVRNETMHLEDPLFSETKLTLGADIQTLRFVDGSPFLPRFGFYLTVAQAKWTNHFAMFDADANITGAQFEGAIYASGHLVNGLNLLISFVALKPYGHDLPVQYIVNIAPAIGATWGAN